MADDLLAAQRCVPCDEPGLLQTRIIRPQLKRILAKSGLGRCLVCSQRAIRAHLGSGLALRRHVLHASNSACRRGQSAVVKAAHFARGLMCQTQAFSGVGVKFQIIGIYSRLLVSTALPFPP